VSSLTSGGDGKGTTGGTTGNGNPTAACAAKSSLTELLPLVVNQTQQNTNVVFMIDTSGSMKEEALRLRANLEGFVSRVKSEALSQQRIRFAVVGTEGSIFDRNSPLLPAPYRANALVDDVYWHYNLVFSRDKFLATLGVLGASSYQPAGAIFPTIIDKSKYRTIADLDVSSTSACRGTNLYDCDALNHVVIVTDDGETLSGCTPGMLRSNPSCIEDTFDSTLKTHLAKTGSSYRLHAIHYTSTSVPTATCTPGTAGDIWTPYTSLATATGGLSLDLCQDDWNPLFDQLKERIVGSSRPTAFAQCGKSNREIISVSLKLKDGQVIPLAIKDVIYAAPSGNAAATLYLPGSVLEAKGVAFSQVAGLVVESKLK